MRGTWLFWLITLGPAFAPAQRITTELICRWESPAMPAKRHTIATATYQWLTEDIALLRFPTPESAASAQRALLEQKGAVTVQYNHRVAFREVPNDPQYFRQANMQRSGYEEAWNLTTGGRTAGGVPIVTAVLDAGFDTDHVDLLGNIWKNEAEIPGDGIDNDANGFVDDTNGWNFVDQSPDHPADVHGTAVAGLLGATGNNATGVTGTNWQARLMLFTISTVADIIAAYQYVIDQRSEYNRTGGSAGAFVVATNASFGIEDATCEDFPVWGDMYDRLGQVGVLTAASVANVGRDADLAGDMPIDCPSNFLIGVTNVDADDGLFAASGYGRENVDLAAPGEQSYTTRPGNTYGTFGSTSAAAPYVTGAISLLYATPSCPSLEAGARTDPAPAALRVRAAILASVRPESSLSGITVTGGIIDAGAAQAAILDDCLEEGAAFGIQIAFPNPTSGRLQVLTTARALPENAEVQLFDAMGRRVGGAAFFRYRVDPVGLEADLSGLPAGWYYLRVTDENRVAGINFLKQ
ncbi:putative secreted protein (Por secretion system target) [Neolewinella xylanilytica]|uniref:Putative secreted protein (Por secretion system target) n=2 Tax=Neolewinella xylanilytica TaxID=1514080 RepID=A0A2S6I5U2_9BACT|nr:putative secreted protein (Por secretion system target) [Neolewinella xylanilytica]